MADEEKQAGDEVEEVDPEVAAAKAKKKKTVLLSGGLVALMCVGYLLMLMAVPDDGEAEMVPFDGPFVALLGEAPLQVNLAGPGRRFLLMQANITYEAYGEPYVSDRIADLVYLAQLQDAMITLASQKEAAELAEPSGKDVFKQELLATIKDLIFPLHLGESSPPEKPDEESGLAPGLSWDASTYRGGIQNGRIHLDALARTIRLDEGTPIGFEGTEPDLLIESGSGETLFVDTTRIDPEFKGEVMVGVNGRVKDLLWADFKLQ